MVFILKNLTLYVSSLRYKLYLIHQLIPFLFTDPIIRNRISLIFSILKGDHKYQIVLNTGLSVTFKSIQFETLMNLLRVLRLSAFYSTKSDGTIILSFDTKNQFSINMTDITPETENLLDLFYLGVVHGGIFITEDDTETLRNKKTLKITEKNGKKIVETYNGVKFYLDIFLSGVSEAFVGYTHEMTPNEDWKGKVVVDVGASIGDTPLYYASMGAKVYAFEMTKDNYDGLLRNLELNPQFTDNIIPINAAIGKDGLIDYYQDSIMRTGQQGGASIFVSKFGRSRDSNIELKKMQTQGYTLDAVFKKFNINNIDLLKMDCKGCEFSLTEDSLRNVKKIKIEYFKVDESHHLEDLLKMLTKSGFKYRLFQYEPLTLKSLGIAGKIYAERVSG